MMERASIRRQIFPAHVFLKEYDDRQVESVDSPNLRFLRVFRVNMSVASSRGHQIIGAQKCDHEFIEAGRIFDVASVAGPGQDLVHSARN